MLHKGLFLKEILGRNINKVTGEWLDKSEKMEAYYHKYLRREKGTILRAVAAKHRKRVEAWNWVHSMYGL